MKSTTLVAVVALVLGLLLAGGGSVVLAHARAAVRSTHPRHATITQYPAALSALLGFLLSSVAGGMLCWQLAPLRGTVAVVAASASGVILFALVGAGFARVADRVEAGRLQQIPDEVHRPISPVVAALRALPAAPGPDTPVTTRGQAITSASPAQARTPVSRTPPALPAGVTTPALPAQRPAGGDPAASAVETGVRPGGHAYGDALSTPLVEVRRPARAPLPRPAPPPAATQDDRRSASAWDVPDEDLRAGWMYHDDADGWFLAIGTPGGALLLLGLPSFALVDPNGPDAPVGALRRAGAAELTVLPEAADPPSDPDPRPARSDQDDRDEPGPEASASSEESDAGREATTATEPTDGTETELRKADTDHKESAEPPNVTSAPNEAEEGRPGPASHHSDKDSRADSS